MRLLKTLSVSALPLFLPFVANATLGGGEATIQSDTLVLHARQKEIQIRDRYQIREIQAGSQTVREYLSIEGTVFAVTWTGTPQSLAQVLGPYYPKYVKALSNQRAVSREHLPIVLVSDRLSSGAYLPRLIPSGLDPSEIR